MNERAHVQPWPSPCLKYLITVMIKIRTLQYNQPALTHSLSLSLSRHTSQYPHCLKFPELYHTSQGFCALAYAGLLALLLASWNLPVIFPDPDQEFSPHGRPPWLLQLGVTDTSSSDTPVPATILFHREACHCSQACLATWGPGNSWHLHARCSAWVQARHRISVNTAAWIRER